MGHEIKGLFPVSNSNLHFFPHLQFNDVRKIRNRRDEAENGRNMEKKKNRAVMGNGQFMVVRVEVSRNS